MLARFTQADTMVFNDQVSGMNRYMYVSGNPVKYRDPTGHACAGNYWLVIGVLMGGPILGAGIGVYGNYTGGGQSCTAGMPKEEQALQIFFLSFTQEEGIAENEKALRMMAVQMYYESQASQGKPTFLNQISRRDLGLLLIHRVINEGESVDKMLAVWGLMTYGVTEPKKGVDRASFWHDKYAPNPTKPENRQGNKEWIKQAWKRASGPGDIVAAATGTVIFTTVNLVHDITNIRSGRYKNLGNPKKWRF